MNPTNLAQANETTGSDLAGEGSRSRRIDDILELEAALCRALGPGQQQPWLEADLTISQFKTLFALSTSVDALGLRVSDLARVLGVTPATASTALDRLVERGLVERREDPQDRRQHRCRLAPAGQQLLASHYEAARIRNRHLLETLSVEELEVVLDSIQILVRAAERLARPVEPKASR
jgi:DNA-binding MarR family transcriptional regulator